MFQLLSIFGPAAITFVIVSKLCKKQETNYLLAAAKIFAYAAVNAGIVLAILSPVGRAELILMENGIRELRYGKIAYIVSIVIAIVMGWVIAAISKRVEIGLDVTKEKKDVASEISK